MQTGFTRNTDTLCIAGRRYGNPGGTPVYLMHGFPYDVACYDVIAEKLAAHGCHVIVPFLRGYGPTRFLNDATLRSGQQAALGKDLLALMDANSDDRAVVAGFDWGGRAACVVSALWPERVIGLVSCGGYNIQDIARSSEPADPQQEFQYWYQYYFHSERGRAGLEKNRHALCRLLWSLWSPQWHFSDDIFSNSAPSFDNPDFVDVVIHSYRHRFGLVDGDPALEPLEVALACQPQITVPTLALTGTDNGVMTSQSSAQLARRFSGPFDHWELDGIGHNVPQEAPDRFAQAVLELL